MNTLKKSFRSAAAPVALVSSVLGFIGDVLAPLGEFAPWVAGLSVLITIGAIASLAMQYRRHRQLDAGSQAAGVFVMGVCSTVIFSVWAVITGSAPERGFLASNSAPIAQMQASLLNLEKDVADIKTTTQQIANTTTRTADQVDAIATAQAAGFAQMQSAFAALQANGSIVPDPQTPQAWYSNARVYQLKGDTANAIKAYEGFAAFQLDFVDPYQSYADLLTATRGAAQARQRLSDLRLAQIANPALELALIGLLDAPAERLERLNALVARQAAFAPAYLALGQEYDRALQRGVTSDLLNRQHTAYTRLFALEENQGFSRFYIDKSLAQAQLVTARERLAGYARMRDVMGTVEIQATLYYNGVQIAIVAADVAFARQILIGIDEPTPTIDTGKNAAGTPNTIVGPVKVEPGPHTLYARIIDFNGVASSVYSRTVQVDSIAVVFVQQPKDFSTNRIPGLFSVGILNSGGAEPVTYFWSLDNAALDQRLDGISVMAIPVDNLTPGPHTLHIQAAFPDGGKTPVVAFPFVVND